MAESHPWMKRFYPLHHYGEAFFLYPHTRKHSVILNKKMYFNPDTGKLISDKLETIPSWPLGEIACDDDKYSYGNWDRHSRSIYYNHTKRWFTPPDSDWED